METLRVEPSNEWDQLEHDLIYKRELIDERRSNLIIRVYWLSLTNEISLFLSDTETDRSCEFLIPNDRVLDARDHPLAYATNAGLYPFQPREKTDDGA